MWIGLLYLEEEQVEEETEEETTDDEEEDCGPMDGDEEERSDELWDQFVYSLRESKFVSPLV